MKDDERDEKIKELEKKINELEGEKSRLDRIKHVEWRIRNLENELCKGYYKCSGGDKLLIMGFYPKEKAIQLGIITGNDLSVSTEDKYTRIFDGDRDTGIMLFNVAQTSKPGHRDMLYIDMSKCTYIY